VAVIAEVGMHSDVKVLVYVAAFQPDVGESIVTLAAKMPAASKSIGPVVKGVRRFTAERSSLLTGRRASFWTANRVMG